MKRFLAVVLLGLLAAGCLQTRKDVAQVETQKGFQDQIASLQKSQADDEARYQELSSQVRAQQGQIESLEHNFSSVSKTEGDSRAEKEKALEERLKAMEVTLTELQDKVGALEKGAVTAAPTKEKGKKKDEYAEAEDLFEKKEWKKSIAAYQKYRESTPKGRYYANATYKMGVAFQELGMNEEASVFFQEVVDKFPDTGPAKKSSYRLNTMKQKKK